ncbi:MAG: rhodanese-like domain-containing protein [Candidatus Omnitrophota bacterium]
MRRFYRAFAQSFILIAIGAIIGAAVNALSSQPIPWIRPPKSMEEKWPAADAQTVLQHIQDGSAILIDARDANEFEAGHLPGAVNIPASEFRKSFQEFADNLPRDIPLIVYCQGGECDQSHEVIQQLADLGFEKLLLFPGGWQEWEKEKFPNEKSSS